MDPILQPVDDKLTSQAQQITQLEAQLAVIQSIATFPDLECSAWLVAPGLAGGGSNTAVPSQAAPGAQSAFIGIAPSGPYANGYFYKKLGPLPEKTIFTYALSFLFATAPESSASQAVELDIQQVIAGVVYNFGWQFDFADNLLRVWDRGGKAWVSTKLPCHRWAAGQWMNIVAEQHRGSDRVTHDAITINGQRLPINMSFPAPQLNLSDMLNCAVQLDGNKSGAAYRLYLDRVRLTAQ